MFMRVINHGITGPETRLVDALLRKEWTRRIPRELQLLKLCMMIQLDINNTDSRTMCRLANDLHDQQQAEWLDGDSIKSYNDLVADIRERVLSFLEYLFKIMNNTSSCSNIRTMEVLSAIQLSFLATYIQEYAC